MTSTETASVPAEAGIHLRYPVEILGPDASLETLRFYENFHAAEAMKADIALLWHSHHLREVHARLMKKGEPLECTPDLPR